MIELKNIREPVFTNAKRVILFTLKVGTLIRTFDFRAHPVVPNRKFLLLTDSLSSLYAILDKLNRSTYSLHAPHSHLNQYISHPYMDSGLWNTTLWTLQRNKLLGKT